MQSVTTALQWLVNNRGTVFTTIEFVGFVVGIVALLIAAVEFKHVRKLLGSTEQILDSMSTRFVGEFPYNLGAITESLTRARARVDVMVDIAAYGHYSSPEAFLKYFQELEKLAVEPDVELRMIVYNETLNESSRDDQFGGEVAFAKIREDRKFEQYFAKHEKDRPANYNGFVSFLKIREEQRKTALQSSGAKIKESNERFRFFLWMVDDVEAVFAFQVCGEHFREICFSTKDGNLIRTFADVFKQAWDQPAETRASAA